MKLLAVLITEQCKEGLVTLNRLKKYRRTKQKLLLQGADIPLDDTALNLGFSHGLTLQD